MAKKRDFIFDFPTDLPRLVNGAKRLRGKWRFGICRYRERRSDKQNAAYWPLEVIPFAEWLSEKRGERVTEDVAHEILKDTLLREPVVDSNGEVIFDTQGNPLMRTKSTTELTTTEFADYYENVRNLLNELSDGEIDVPDPDPDYLLKQKDSGNGVRTAR